MLLLNFVNPLAAIVNAVQILDLQKHEQPLQEKATHIIRRQVGHLVVLVNEVLEVSRILSGGIQLHQEEVDRRDIVQHSQPGLRVGLTVVRELVEMQRGTVEAHSNGLGEGSEFIVRLPLLTPMQVDDQTLILEKRDRSASWPYPVRAISFVCLNSPCDEAAVQLWLSL